MQNSTTWKFWLAITGGLLLFLYLIKSILLPFVLGILMAYFLDPAADWLERKKFSRNMATVIITIGFFSLLALGTLTVLPLLAHQAMDLFAALPSYVSAMEMQYAPYVERYLGQLPPEQMESVRNAVNESSAAVLRIVSEFATKIFYSGFALLNLLSLVLITPVVTFYLIRDWDRVVKHIDELLPRKQLETIRAQVRAIDKTLAGFLRGQINVCIILAFYYGLALSITGLKFGMAIGIATGLLVIFPYVGFFVGLALGMGIALVQFSSMIDIGLVLAAFMVGQALESVFVTPKLVGDKVGLHPLWIIFGMLAGGALLGPVGVLLAIPLTAILGVLIRFWLERYRKSSLYHGTKPAA